MCTTRQMARGGGGRADGACEFGVQTEASVTNRLVATDPRVDMVADFCERRGPTSEQAYNQRLVISLASKMERLPAIK